jgi:OFA family oxalate/formate antiporter-like MFS transporter
MCAWSVYRTPLVKAFHWSISEVTLTFMICILALGLGASFGGLRLAKAGPRTVAITGAIVYGAGTMLASLSANHLPILYLTYGVIGGLGLGFACIVPVAVQVKWFPDRRGFITGVAVGGFGAGALATACRNAAHRKRRRDADSCLRGYRIHGVVTELRPLLAPTPQPSCSGKVSLLWK